MVVKLPDEKEKAVMAKTDKKYNFVRKGGKSIIERRPIFSPDGQFLVVAVENTVRVYSVRTGECVRTLETEGHTDDLVAIEFPSDERHNLFGCSTKGVVTIWTWENGAVLREKQMNLPHGSEILSFDLLNSQICLLTLGIPAHNIIKLLAYELRTGDIKIEYGYTQPEYHNMVCVSLGYYNEEQFVALTNGTKMLFIQNLNRPQVANSIINQSHIRLLSCTAHIGMVAVTDALGRAFVLRGNLFDTRGKVGREILHWHFLPAMCSAFSIEGNYLYTGGMEKVIVKWTLGQKDRIMMPRVPGHIKYLTTSKTHMAVSLGNNSIIIANTLLEATGTILECGGLSPVMRAIGGTLIYHQAMGGLLIPGRTGHLQLYSTASDKVLYNIDITQQNEIPAERYNLIPLDTEITCAAINADGTWLATSEYRNDGINYPEEKLKFWLAKPKNPNPFKLRTCVNLSHGGCRVVALTFNSTGQYCVSAGLDQKFRIWKRKGKKSDEPDFFCITACYYSSGIGQSMSHDILNKIKHHNVTTYEKQAHPYLRKIEKDDVLEKIFNMHKVDSLVKEDVFDSGMAHDNDADMGGISISQDGSLIAAWFGCKLTLWDSHLCNIRTTLAHPALRPKGNQVMFGSHDASHYLVCTTENCLAVWSLLSLTMKWMVQIRPSCLSADRDSNRMAVVTQENDLYVFTPHISTPILTRKHLCSPETGVFKQMTFGAATNNDIRLFLMRNNSEIYALEPEKPDAGRLEAISWRHQPVSKFSALLAEQSGTAVKAMNKLRAVGQWDAGKKATGAATQILSAAPHMIPPISLLCTTFLEQIALKQEKSIDKKKTVKKEINKNQEEENDKKEDESESDAESNEEELPSTEVKEEKIEKPLGGLSPKAMELWTPNYEAIKEKRLAKIMKDDFLDQEATSALIGV